MIKLKLEIGKLKTKYPAGKVIFNKNIIHNGPYNIEELEFCPVIGTNTLTVSLENKADRDTTLEGNQITSDLYVKIVDIKCDITGDSAGSLDTIGNYKTDQEEIIKTYGFLSYNGTYTFTFDYPFFVFQKNKIFYQ